MFIGDCKIVEAKERNSNIELLRIVSMIMIVSLHFLNYCDLLKNTPVNNINYYVLWLVEITSYVSVNTYVLISGYFLINSKFSVKKLMMLILEVVFYSGGIYVVFCLLGFVKFGIKECIVNFFAIKQYWFIWVYIGLYLIFPLINYFIKCLDKKKMQVCIGILLILLSLYIPTNMLTIGNGMSIDWFVTLYIIGAYIRKFCDFSKKKGFKYALMYWIPIVFLFMCTIIVTKLSGNSFTYSSIRYILIRYNSIFVLVASIGLFMLFANIKLNKIFGKIINLLGKLTLGVYLIHGNVNVTNILWDKVGEIFNYIDKWWFVFTFLGIVTGIFLICATIDYLRMILFLPIKKLIGRIGIIDRFEARFFDLG